MDSQSKLDLIAAGAILTMFLGVYALTLTRFGLVLIVGGALVVLLLMLKVLRKRP